MCVKWVGKKKKKNQTDTSLGCLFVVSFFLIPDTRSVKNNNEHETKIKYMHNDSKDFNLFLSSPFLVGVFIVYIVNSTFDAMVLSLLYSDLYTAQRRTMFCDIIYCDILISSVISPFLLPIRYISTDCCGYS